LGEQKQADVLVLEQSPEGSLVLVGEVSSNRALRARLFS
jgi:hypothetical protein